jgi:hypothetical protein
MLNTTCDSPASLIPKKPGLPQRKKHFVLKIILLQPYLHFIIIHYIIAKKNSFQYKAL